MTESTLLRRIRLVLGRDPRVALWRNNVGVLRDARGTPIRYGLAVGSADLIGLVSPHGRMIALEVKAPCGRVSAAQQQWLALVRAHGGVAEVVRTVEEAERALDTAARAAVGSTC